MATVTKTKSRRKIRASALVHLTLDPSPRLRTIRHQMMADGNRSRRNYETVATELRRIMAAARQRKVQ